MHQSRSKKDSPLVSIIVPTRNSIRTIKDTLNSIKKQTYRNIEVIIVDQASHDDTQKVAKKLGAKVLNAKADVFYSAPPVSRNIGAKYSKGQFLLHIDSDMILSQNVVADGVKTFQSNRNLLALKIHEVDTGTGFWSHAKKFERKFYVGYNLIEAARFIRRDVFFKLGGYDETLRSAEDWDMSQRILNLGKIGQVTPLIHHNLGRMSYAYQIHKKFNYGITLEKILKKHQFTFKQNFLMVFRSVYFKKWYLFFQDPIGALGFLILRPSELIAYLFGIIWARYKNIKI